MKGTMGSIVPKPRIRTDFVREEAGIAENPAA